MTQTGSPRSFVLEVQLSAALEHKNFACPKPRGFAAYDSEVRPNHAEPRDERSAGGSATDRAMTFYLIEGSTHCFRTDLSAKASALEHSITCRFAFLRDWLAFSDCRLFDCSGPSPYLLFSREHRLHAFLQLLRRDVFFMRGYPPEMAERVLELARPVAVKLIHDRLAFFGAGGKRFLKKRVDVFDVKMDADRRSTKRFRRLTAVFRKFIRQHDHRIA